MRHIIALLLVTALLLSGCGFVERANQRPGRNTSGPQVAAPVTETVKETAPAAVETEPTEAPTTEPTTIPTEPQVLSNPLNGEILDEPYTGRIFASTISNIREALPHVGVNDADILMEMFVNGSIDRCLALFTDLSDVEQIGSTRSTRLMFSDIAQHYDAVLCHAGGSSKALGDVSSRGLDNINLDHWSADNTYSIRDETRNREIGYEHCLMGLGPGILEYAEKNGIPTTGDPDKDYFLRFTEDGTPTDGETAERISITLTYNEAKKETVMVYDGVLGKYVFNEYDRALADGLTGEPEAFQNVIVMFANISLDGIYHVADFVAGGEGYFACGGKIVPIRWECDNENAPFRFLTQDGQVLELGQGNTYIAICTPESPVVYEENTIPEETTSGTT